MSQQRWGSFSQQFRCGFTGCALCARHRAVSLSLTAYVLPRTRAKEHCYYTERLGPRESTTGTSAFPRKFYLGECWDKCSQLAEGRKLWGEGLLCREGGLEAASQLCIGDFSGNQTASDVSEPQTVRVKGTLLPSCPKGWARDLLRKHVEREAPHLIPQNVFPTYHCFSVHYNMTTCIFREENALEHERLQWYLVKQLGISLQVSDFD